MAKRNITRTIKTTTATALTVNPATAETSNANLILSGTFKDEAAFLKQAKKLYETEDYIIVAVNNMVVEEHLYRMAEEKFLASAELVK